MTKILLRVMIITAVMASILILDSSADNAKLLPEIVIMKINPTAPVIAEKIKAIQTISENKIYPRDETFLTEPTIIIDISPISNAKQALPTGPVDEFTVLNEFTQDRTDHVRNEIHCLALNTFHEAAQENYIGKLAVANVTQTRVNSNRWPSTFCDVVKEGYRVGKMWGCQFSWNCDGRSDKVHMHAKTKTGEVLREGIYTAWVESVKIAIDVYDKKATDVTAGATHYYNPAICYKWSVRVDKDGNRLTAASHEDFVDRVEPQTVACHSKWGFKGLNNGTFIRTPSRFATNGMIDSHLFLIERDPSQLANN